MSIFRLSLGVKFSFDYNSVRKNVFLSVCYCLDARIPSREIEQKVKFGGTIVYEDLYSKFLFRYFKVFRLHAILLAAAVQAHNGKDQGYWYTIGRGLFSCLFAFVSGVDYFFATT